MSSASTDNQSSTSSFDRTPRLTGDALQERRRRWFAKFPLCVECEAQGKVSAAQELDHIVPLFKGGADDETNLQGLCIPCHKEKTYRDKGFAPRPAAIGADGWPLSDGGSIQRGGSDEKEFGQLRNRPRSTAVLNRNFSKTDDEPGMVIA